MDYKYPLFPYEGYSKAYSSTFFRERTIATLPVPLMFHTTILTQDEREMIVYGGFDMDKELVTN